MYYNQELGLCIEFGPVRVDSVRRGGAPPWIKSPLRRFTPSWTFTRVACDGLLPFVHPFLSQVSPTSKTSQRPFVPPPDVFAVLQAPQKPWAWSPWATEMWPPWKANGPEHVMESVVVLAPPPPRPPGRCGSALLRETREVFWGCLLGKTGPEKRIADEFSPFRPFFGAWVHHRR